MGKIFQAFFYLKMIVLLFSEIKIQTDVYAHYLNDLKKNNELQNLYQLNLDAYEFKMQEVYTKTVSGVDYYYIEDNTIIKTFSNDKNWSKKW